MAENNPTDPVASVEHAAHPASGWGELVRLLDYAMLALAVCALLSAGIRRYFAWESGGAVGVHNAEHVQNVGPAGKQSVERVLPPS